MKNWIIGTIIISTLGIAIAIHTRDSFGYWASGFLIGYPLGALLVRALLHKHLKPEYFGEIESDAADIHREDKEKQDTRD